MVLPVSPVAPTKNTVCFDIFKSKYAAEQFIVPVNDADGDSKGESMGIFSSFKSDSGQRIAPETATNFDYLLTPCLETL